MSRTKHLSSVLLGALLGTMVGCSAEPSQVLSPDQASAPAARSGPAGPSLPLRHILEEEDEEPGVFTETGMAGDPVAGKQFFNQALTLQPNASNGLTKAIVSNGRSCATCHIAEDLFSLTPKNASRRPSSDPLITGLMADADPDVAPGTPEFEALRSLMLTHLRRHGLIRIVLPNPNYDPKRGNVADNPQYLRQFRSVPTNMNVATGIEVEGELSENGREVGEADLFTMWDAREESLENQASSASLGHAQVRFVDGSADARKQLDRKIALDIAAFQRSVTAIPATGLNPPFVPVKDPAFEEFGEPLEQTPLMPRLGDGFDYAAIKDQWLPDMPPLSKFSSRQAAGFRTFVGTPQKPGCIVCHNMPVTLAGGVELSETAMVSEENKLGLPMQTLRLWDEESQAFETVTTPDPGLAGITGKLDDLNKFKISQLRGTSKMARYFHDNHERDLDGVIVHYADAFPELFGDLTLAQRQDLKTFLQML